MAVNAQRVRYYLTLTDAFQAATALAADCDAFLINNDTNGSVSDISYTKPNNSELSTGPARR
jgi:predicted nucleic acid-binding protein